MCCGKDALAQAQSSNARPGMNNTRETRARLQRKEVHKAYCNLLDVEQELFTLKRQIENEEDEVLPRNVRVGDAPVSYTHLTLPTISSV